MVAGPLVPAAAAAVARSVTGAGLLVTVCVGDRAERPGSAGKPGGKPVGKPVLAVSTPHDADTRGLGSGVSPPVATRYVTLSAGGCGVSRT